MTEKEFYAYINDNEDIQKLIQKYSQNDEKYVDYAYKTYMYKLQPYLSLITQWKNDENPPNEEIIRITLDIPKTLWSIYKKFDLIRAHLDLDKSIMKFKAQKNLEEAVNIGLKKEQPIAKLHEMQMQRYDDDYNKRKQGEKTEQLPTSVEIKFGNGKMSDDDIKKKSGTKYEG